MIMNFQDIYSEFVKIKFNVKISYLNIKEFNKIVNFPIKQEPQFGEINLDYTHLKNTNGICLILLNNQEEVKITIPEILNNIPNLQYKSINYLNKKMAAVTAGLAQYGKNQLVYNEDFGFHCNILTILIFNPVTNLPIRKEPNYSYMDLCANCDECIKNCPAHAIHADDYPGWLDRMACQNFFLFGNHNIIPSTKYGVNAFLGYPFSEEQLKQVVSQSDFKKLFGFFNSEGKVVYNNQIYNVDMHYCKECQNQLSCRKIEFTYDKDYYKIN